LYKYFNVSGRIQIKEAVAATIKAIISHEKLAPNHESNAAAKKPTPIHREEPSPRWNSKKIKPTASIKNQ
jgi:hypothetical protein